MKQLFTLACTLWKLGFMYFILPGAIRMLSKRCPASPSPSPVLLAAIPVSQLIQDLSLGLIAAEGSVLFQCLPLTNFDSVLTTNRVWFSRSCQSQQSQQSKPSADPGNLNKCQHCTLQLTSTERASDLKHTDIWLSQYNGTADKRPPFLHHLTFPSISSCEQIHQQGPPSSRTTST